MNQDTRGYGWSWGGGSSWRGWDDSSDRHTWEDRSHGSRWEDRSHGSRWEETRPDTGATEDSVETSRWSRRHREETARYEPEIHTMQEHLANILLHKCNAYRFFSVETFSGYV